MMECAVHLAGATSMSIPTRLLAVLFLLAPITTVRADVKHGEELVRGVNCGLPKDAVLHPSSESLFKSPAVIENKSFGAVKTTHASGVVRFVRCKFTNSGFVSAASDPAVANPGTDLYTVQRAGAGSVELEDCEVYGGKSVAINGVDKITRTYVTEGNDLLRAAPGESVWTEVLGDKILMASAESHSDVMQVTFGKQQTTETPQLARITVLRCRFDPRNNIGADGKAGQSGNAAIQLGSFGPHTGVEGRITDCYFDGGAYTLGGGGKGDLGGPVVVRGCKFGRNAVYGPVHPGWRTNHDVDGSNVMADTGEPLPAKFSRK
jgi:hypothetical protein